MLFVEAILYIYLTISCAPRSRRAGPRRGGRPQCRPRPAVEPRAARRRRLCNVIYLSLYIYIYIYIERLYICYTYYVI